MNTNNYCQSGRLGVCSLLLVAFIILKVCNIITWSWWLVLIPLWIQLGFIVFLCILYVLALTIGRYDY
jgi:hypothetical protein